MKIEDYLWYKYGDGKKDATAFIQMVINREHFEVPNGSFVISETLNRTQ